MKFLFTSMLLLWHLNAQAQLPPPCPSNTEPPSDLCTATCLYCDFNGIHSTTTGYTGQTPPGWCGVAENEQWLSFLASCASVTFIATPSNCKDGNGLQIGMYANCDSMPLGCNGGTVGGGTIPVSVTAPVTVGSHYYLCIDGFAGDECDFNITVVPPSCASTPMLLPTLPIIGGAAICPGGSGNYTVPSVSGASYYIWDGPPGSTINGAPPPVTLLAPGGTSVSIEFPPSPSVGVFPICVQPVNSCNDGTVQCKNIQIQPIPQTVFPNVTVCFEDTPYILPWGDEANSTGLYSTTLTTSAGCDSTLRQFVLIKPPVQALYPPVFLCPGDTFYVCGVPFYQAGSYNETCTDSNGCDSTVIFSIIINPVNAQIIPAGPTPGVSVPMNNDTLCLTPNQPTIILNAAATPGTITWFINGAFASSGTQISISQAGQVVLCVNQGFGALSCTRCDTIQVLSGQLLAGTTGPIIGPDTICNTELLELSIDPVAGATEYIWQLPIGFNQVGNGPNIQVTATNHWLSNGTFDFCVTPADGCNQALKTCKSIYITEGLEWEIFMPVICLDTFQYDCGHWNYEQPEMHTHPNTQGCDTLVNIFSFSSPIIFQNLGTITICQSDTFYLDQKAYTIPGVYIDTFYNSATACLTGYRNFTLKFAKPIANIENTLGSNNAICLSANQPLIAADSAQFYTWTNSNGQVLGTDRFFIPALPGVYYLEASVPSDSSLCSAFDSVTVLAVDFTSHQISQNIDCSSLTGVLTVDPFLPTQYTYTWYSQNQQVLGTGQFLNIDTSGTYYVLIDANGCQATFSININLSPAIQYTLNWVTLYIDSDENCAVSGTDFKASNVYVHAEKIGGGGLTLVSDAQGRVQFPLTEGLYNISVGQQPISNGLTCPLQLMIPKCSAGIVQDTAFLRMTISTDEPNKSNALTISPNPATHIIQVRGDVFAEGELVNWQIMNELGQVVKSGKNAQYPLNLNTVGLPSGMYRIYVQDEKVAAYGKFIRSH